jgi:hypothetical protein
MLDWKETDLLVYEKRVGMRKGKRFVIFYEQS